MGYNLQDTIRVQSSNLYNWIKNQTYANMGGVLRIESALALTVQSRIDGQMGRAWLRRSSLTITRTTPAVPMFF